MTEADTKKPTVLLIEDEVQIRRLLRVFLERNGYQVREAPTGEEGIGEAARCCPDAVLLDWGYLIWTAWPCSNGCVNGVRFPS